MSISLRIKRHLAENKISYASLTHSATYTAQDTAATMHISGQEVAKTVVVQAGYDYYLVVLPASRHVSVEKLGMEIGKPVRLATEREFYSLFPDCEVGAMPPLGEIYGLSVYVDESLSCDKEIIFNAGTHRDAIRMNFADFLRLSRPRVCSLAI